MDNMGACECGHSPEEHGRDPAFPGSTACQVSGCDCIAYEEINDDEEEE